MQKENAKLREENERLRAALEIAIQPLRNAASTKLSFVSTDARMRLRKIEEILALCAALASPAPSDSDPDVDAATGCADDQSGLGAAVALLGRERVDQIMSGADSAPGTDWRKLAMDMMAAIDDPERVPSIAEFHVYRAAWDAMYQAVRREREREKEGKAS